LKVDASVSATMILSNNLSISRSSAYLCQTNSSPKRAHCIW